MAKRTPNNTGWEVSPQKPKNEPDRGLNLLVFVVVFTAIFLTAWFLGLVVFVASRNMETTVTRVNMASIRTARQSHFEAAEYVEPKAYALEEPDPFVLAEFDRMMLEINPDFVCWIYIGGTNIDYPVVRAADNEKYLDLTFFGEPNRHGAIFMDYRNMGAFVPHIIIYGHNTRDGTKFGSLRYFLDDGFLRENPYISLITNGRVVKYRIFSARLTDVYDPAYFLDFSEPGSFRAFLERNGAPPGASQIVTLSTCVSRGRDYERLVVQGSLVE